MFCCQEFALPFFPCFLTGNWSQQSLDFPRTLTDYYSLNRGAPYNTPKKWNIY